MRILIVALIVLVTSRNSQILAQQQVEQPPLNRLAKNQALDILDVPLLTLKYSEGYPRVAFSPDGKLLASSNNHTIRLTDLQTGAAVRVCRGLGLGSLAFSPDGKSLLVRASGGIRVLRLPTLVEQHTLEVTAWDTGMAVSPDSLRVVSTDSEGKVSQWDLATGEKAQTLDADGKKVTHVRFSPEGSVLAMLDSESRCEIYDARTLARITEAAQFGCRKAELLFSPRGQQLAVGTEHGVYFWSYHTEHPRLVILPERLRAKPRPGMNFGGGITKVSPDLRTAATQMEFGDIGIWDIARRKVLETLPAGHRPDTFGGGVTSMLFSEQGDLLATTNRSGHVEVWRLRGDRQPVPLAEPIAADEVSGRWGPTVNGIRTRLMMEPVWPDATTTREQRVDASRMPVSEGVWWRASLQVQNTTAQKVTVVWPEVRRDRGYRVTTEDGQSIPYQVLAGDREMTRKIPITISAKGNITTMSSLLVGRNHDLSRPGKYRLQFPRTEVQPPLTDEVTNPILPESNVLEFENSGPVQAGK